MCCRRVSQYMFFGVDGLSSNGLVLADRVTAIAGHGPAAPFSRPHHSADYVPLADPCPPGCQSPFRPISRSPSQPFEVLVDTPRRRQLILHVRYLLRHFTPRIAALYFFVYIHTASHPPRGRQHSLHYCQSASPLRS